MTISDIISCKFRNEKVPKVHLENALIIASHCANICEQRGKKEKGNHTVHRATQTKKKHRFRRLKDKQKQYKLILKFKKRSKRKKRSNSLKSRIIPEKKSNKYIMYKLT